MMYTVSCYPKSHRMDPDLIREHRPTDTSQILDFCYLMFVYFMYPETKNLTLEEVAKVFDGDRSGNEFEAGMVTEVSEELGKEDVQVEVKRM